MIHPDFEVKYISDEEGFGVIAMKLVPKGTITSIESPFDLIVTADKFKHLNPVHLDFLKKHGYRKATGETVLDWDHGRWVNHRFFNTGVFTPYDFSLAVRDIQPGEQLAWDYGFVNRGRKFEPRPEEGMFRSEVRTDDLLVHYAHWDAQIVESLRHFNGVVQPLATYIKPSVWTKLERVLSGQEAPQSIKTLHLDDQTERAIPLARKITERSRRTAKGGISEYH